MKYGYRIVSLNEKGERRSYSLCSCGTSKIRILREDGSDVDTAKQETISQFPPTSFTAGGKMYSDIAQLTAKKVANAPILHNYYWDGDQPAKSWFLDRYSREVFGYFERFPCFDSEDYLYEKRYNRWFFIMTETGLTCVQYSDGQSKLHVIEHVSNIERDCLEAMEKEGGWYLREGTEIEEPILQPINDTKQEKNNGSSKPLAHFLKKLISRNN